MTPEGSHTFPTATHWYEIYMTSINVYVNPSQLPPTGMKFIIEKCICKRKCLHGLAHICICTYVCICKHMCIQCMDIQINMYMTMTPYYCHPLT